jgi:hypothetical protein
MITGFKINSRIRKIGPISIKGWVNGVYCGYVGHTFTLYELPPHKRNITFRRLNYNNHSWENEWEIKSEETFLLQMPYVFLLFDNSTSFIAFGKEPFGKNTTLWFAPLPNTFDSPPGQICTPCCNSVEERLVTFWNSIFYDFANRENRFIGTNIAEHWLGGYSGWANLDLQGLYEKMKWNIVDRGAFKDFQNCMEGLNDSNS